MSKSYDESKHVRNDKGQYANKIKQAKPGELPDETAAEYTTDLTRTILDDYELDYGNAEIWDNGDGTLTITVEAGNESTTSFEVPAGADRQQVLAAMRDNIRGYDADEQFDELWSPGSQCTPTEFMGMLKDDEDFYHRTADAIDHELTDGQFTGVSYSDDDNEPKDVNPYVEDGPSPQLSVDEDATREEKVDNMIDQFGLDATAYEDDSEIAIQCETPNGHFEYVYLPEGVSRADMLRTVAAQFDEFDADDEFSYSYDAHGTIEPSVALAQARDDANYLHAKAKLLNGEALRIELGEK